MGQCLTDLHYNYEALLLHVLTLMAIHLVIRNIKLRILREREGKNRLCLLIPIGSFTITCLEVFLYVEFFLSAGDSIQVGTGEAQHYTENVVGKIARM